MLLSTPQDYKMSTTLVLGVKNVPTTEKTRYITKKIKDNTFEVRLEFPESQITRTLNHVDIHTVMKPSMFNLERVSTLVQEERGHLQCDPQYEDALEYTVHHLLNHYKLTMNMTVEYHFFGNLKATSVEVVSATKA